MKTFEAKLNSVIEGIFKIAIGPAAPPPEIPAEVRALKTIMETNQGVKETDTMRQIKVNHGSIKVGNQVYNLSDGPTGTKTIAIYIEGDNSFIMLPDSMTLKQFVEKYTPK
jgi:hypothetical protein